MSFIEHGVVNRWAFIESPVVHEVGRMTYTGPEDVDGVIYMGFLFPSRSRKGSRVYKVLLDPLSMTTSCACEYKQIHRAKVDLLNLPSPCCWHLRSLALWVRRKANKQKLDDMTTALQHYYSLPQEQRRTA